MYTAFEVVPADLAAAVAAVRALHLGGLSVTMPHKAAIVAELDEVTDTARVLGAVNSVCLRGDTLVGDNTDGAGFVDGLRFSGCDLGDARVGVVGAGGAARAIVAAVAGAGAAEVVVVNRDRGRAEVAAGLAGAVGRVGTGGDLAAVDVIVNATPVGMAGDPGLPLDVEVLSDSQTVVDAVYHPLRTPLLAAAEARGARTVDGLGMLVGQAAVSFTWWTGVEAPIAAMRAAARGAVAP